MKRNTAESRQGPRSDGWIAAALACGFLLLYLRTLCPTVYFGDSGEISTAIVTGGIIHPPGYPVFGLLGRLALHLIPWGEPAFRIGCVVAGAAAAGVAALYLLTRQLRCSRWAAACSAALFGVSHTFWNQSVRVEVYSLHVLLGCLALLAALHYRRSGRTLHLALAALAGSVGMAHHLTIALLAPAALALCGPRLWKDPGLGRRLLAVACVLPVGPALYGLLMLWARQGPLEAWGDPVTLPRLWAHASARLYHGMLQLPDAPRLGRRLVLEGKLLGDNFPYFTAALPFAGAWSLWKRDRGIAAGLLLVVLAFSAYNACYRIEDIDAYYMMVWLGMAALVPAALDELRSRFRAPQAASAFAGVVFAGLLLLPLLRNWSACDLSRVTCVREFARNKLESVDQGGVLISAGDQDMFPLFYVHDVLGVRPDVVHLDRLLVSGTWWNRQRDPSLWYLTRLRRQGLRLPPDVTEQAPVARFVAGDDYLIHLLQDGLRGRPVFLTFARTDLPPAQDAMHFIHWAGERHYFQLQGIVLRLQPKDQPVALAALLARNRRIWDRITFPTPGSVHAEEEIDPDYLVNHYACMLVNLGDLYKQSGDARYARALYHAARTLAPRFQPAAAALSSLEQRPSAPISSG
jgi:hypothetical protein